MSPTRRRVNGDRGSVTVTTLMIPFIIICMMLVVQFGIAMYARQVVQGAAQDGADTAARSGSSVGEGLATTDNLVNQSGGQLIANYRSNATSDGDVITITVQADVVQVVPLMPAIAVRAVGSARVEQFVPAEP